MLLSKWKNMSAGIGVLYPFYSCWLECRLKLMSERVQKKSWTLQSKNNSKHGGADILFGILILD
mgnify:CR=1 FL=1